MLAEIEQGNSFFTELGEVNRPQIVDILNNYAAFYSITKINQFSEATTITATAFTFTSRYSLDVFHGIMPDSGAAGILTAGELQLRALQKLLPGI